MHGFVPNKGPEDQFINRFVRGQRAKRNPQPVATQDWDEPEEPVVEAVEKPQEEEAEQTAIVSAAERLQAQIRERLSSRSDGDTSDDIVQTLQNLLTANK